MAARVPSPVAEKILEELLSRHRVDLHLKDLAPRPLPQRQGHRTGADAEGVGHGTAYRGSGGTVHGPGGHRHREDVLLTPAATDSGPGGTRTDTDTDAHAPILAGRGHGRLEHVDALDPQTFDRLVEGALDEVPERLLALLDNVVFLVEDEPPAEDPDLLGVYDGVPLTDRDGSGWEYGALPDRITLFRGPLTRMCEDVEDLRNEVAITVVHEIAHHFGIEEDALHELGWG